MEQKDSRAGLARLFYALMRLKKELAPAGGIDVRGLFLGFKHVFSKSS